MSTAYMASPASINTHSAIANVSNFFIMSTINLECYKACDYIVEQC